MKAHHKEATVTKLRPGRYKVEFCDKATKFFRSRPQALEAVRYSDRLLAYATNRNVIRLLHWVGCKPPKDSQQIKSSRD